MITDNIPFHQIGRSVIQTELVGIQQMMEMLDQFFDQACELLLNCKGRIIVTGMGKSGHIAKKIAATFASTGSPAFFIHPAEACHGDLGMITKSDMMLAISHSGKTKEILDLLPTIKRLGIPLVTFTSDPHSILAKQANVNLHLGELQEACPLNLAPTTSTTVSLVLGDALAMTLLKARGFTEKDFASRHPGGSLGKKLLWRISDIMHTADEIPKILDNASLSDALIEMSRKGLGMTIIVNQNNQALGIFTDGDLRRVLDKPLNIHHTMINQVMNTRFTTVHPDLLAVEALHLMEKLKVNGFPVIDEAGQLIGALNIHDFLRTGIL